MATLDELSPPAETETLTRSAGWYDDPQGLHDQRYFDGKTWTKHVTHFGPIPCRGCAH